MGILIGLGGTEQGCCESKKAGEGSPCESQEVLETPAIWMRRLRGLILFFIARAQAVGLWSFEI